tara:strand:- start:393 stop:1181 length:789 start_codon:yes stop_codon:yes gene_type:complete
MASESKSEAGWVDTFIDKQGPDGLRKINMGLAIGGTLISGFEGFINAQAANKYQEDSFGDALEYRQREFNHQLEQFKLNTKRARVTLSRNYHTILESIDQSRVSAQEEIYGIIKNARKTHSRAMTSAAEREVYGNTVNVLLDNIMATEFRNIENVAIEQKWGEAARVRQMESLYAEAETTRLASIPRPAGPMDVPQMAPMPNPIAVAMSAGAAGLKAYGQMPPGPESKMGKSQMIPAGNKPGQTLAGGSEPQDFRHPRGAKD